MITGLYVPGNRPDRFATAVASGTELVVLDLQDAVPDDAKDEARDAVRAFLAEPRAAGPTIEVRVAAPADLDVLAALPPEIGLRLPDASGPDDVDAAVARAPGRTMTALIEDARGVEALSEIARHPAVTAIGLGESDLRSDLRATSPAMLEHLRIRLVIAARSAGLPAPMMSAYPAIDDLDGLLADSRAGRALGLRGRMAVHPRQLPVIREAFAADAEEVAWARAVIEAVGAGGVARLPSGEMVDPAMLGRARELLGG